MHMKKVERGILFREISMMLIKSIPEENLHQTQDKM